MISLVPRASRGAGLTILCLGAHSDDIEIGCGGTILALLDGAAKHTVHWVVFSGNTQRQQEAQASADLFLRGAAEWSLVTHGFRDGFFPYDGAAIKEAFEELKRSIVPDVVFTHYHADRHQDHRVVSDLTWNTFRNHLVLEYEIPKYEGDLDRPNSYFTLDDATCRRKIEYLDSAFGSQRDKHWFDEETFRGLMRIRGLESVSEGGYAEAFHARKIVIST